MKYLTKKLILNAEVSGKLFTPLDELNCFNDIDGQIDLYNHSLYYKHFERKIGKFDNFLYIVGYVLDTTFIIEELKKLSLEGLKGYENSVLSWININSSQIDCDEKKKILVNLFSKSKVALIYGSAGTGKSTLISHISNFFNDYKKIFLANTNPAVDNLKNKVISDTNCHFYTIATFLTLKDKSCSILFIDECSTVSNSDMREILTDTSYQLLILVGDTYQIESISFGNWFYIAKNLVNNSIHELITPYRSKDNNLIKLWELVRKLSPNISEYLGKYNISEALDSSIFVKKHNDEIILCLNYDGLYGINNINRLLQNKNPNQPFDCGIWSFKIGDPIIFNENTEYYPLIYNNLKGTIVDIQKTDNNNDDETNNNVLPFQISYAISIHKSQGLEYNSVKIIVTQEISEMISHNIFYTAITRAKEHLTIYWSPETQTTILGKMKPMFNQEDARIIEHNFLKKKDSN